MQSKIAIVTGANRGIGFEIARQLARSGVTVILTSRDEEKGNAACALLKQEGLNVHYRQLEVTDQSGIRKLAEEIKRQFGKLDILVNNAGVFIDGNHRASDLDLDTLRATMESNVYGPLLLSQAFIPLLCNSDSGRIINVSSGLGAINGMSGGYLAYSMSKAALNVVTIKFAAELRNKRISVNAICPGWVRTEMGGANAPRSVEQGADTAVWLATGNIGATGKFFRDRNEIDC